MHHASTDWGCGGVAFSREESAPVLGFVHKWTGEERTNARVHTHESTGVLEMFGVVFWLQHFAKARLLLEVDNDAVMLALSRCYSDSAHMLDGIRHTRRLLAEHFIAVRVISVIGDVFNLVADHLSHNRIEEARCLVREVFQRELVLVSQK